MFNAHRQSVCPAHSEAGRILQQQLPHARRAEGRVGEARRRAGPAGPQPRVLRAAAAARPGACGDGCNKGGQRRQTGNKLLLYYGTSPPAIPPSHHPQHVGCRPPPSQQSRAQSEQHDQRMLAASHTPTAHRATPPQAPFGRLPRAAQHPRSAQHALPAAAGAPIGAGTRRGPRARGPGQAAPTVAEQGGRPVGAEACMHRWWPAL